MCEKENFVIVNDIKNKDYCINQEKDKDLIKQIHTKKIDIKKTIEKTAAGTFLGVKYAYASPLNQHDEFPTEIPELLKNGKKYENALDDEFIEKALECVEKDHGLYIALVYDCSDIGGDEEIIFENKDFDYKTSYKEMYDDYDPSDFITSIGVESSNESVLCIFQEYDEIEADMTSDLGINIRKVNGSYETRIGERSAGLHCWTPPCFDECYRGNISNNVTDKPSNEEPLDGYDCLSYIKLRLLYNAIVFEE